MQNLGDYTYWMQVPRILLTSIIHDYGFIYTEIRDIIMFIFRDNKSPIRTNFEFGKAIGHIYYFTFISSTFSTNVTTVAPTSIDPESGTTVHVLDPES